MTTQLAERAEALRIKIEASKGRDEKLIRALDDFLLELNVSIESYNKLLQTMSSHCRATERDLKEFCLLRDLYSPMKGRLNGFVSSENK